MSDPLDNALSGDPAPNAEPSQEQQPDLAAELVGEGKKYSDYNALAKSRIEADNHISNIEGENAQLREQIAQLEKTRVEQTALSDVVDAVRKATSQSGENQSSLSEEDVLNLVNSTLQGERNRERTEANRDAVKNALLEKFQGNSEAAAKHIRERREQLGLDQKAAAELATNSPDAYLKLMEVDPPQNIGSPNPQSGATVETDKLQSVLNTGRRNYQYYENLRKEMGTRKYHADKQLQAQKMMDLAEQGDGFFR